MTRFEGMAGRLALFVLASIMLAGCARAPIASVPPEERAAIEARMMRDITTLASDDYAGRRPGTDGGRMTVDYLIREMQAAGLVSGTNDPGSAWRAPVELIGLRPEGGEVRFEEGRRSVELSAEQSVIFTNRRRNLVGEAQVVFVGYAASTISADAVQGKVAIMLGDPGKSPARRMALFEQSPAAILTVVDTEEQVARFASAIGEERISRPSEDAELLEGYVTADAMEQVLGVRDWTLLRDAAETDDFEPVELSATASIEATAQRREFTSYNVIGLLPGQVRGSGAVVLMAHWDHLGECAPAGPDRICNGAVDNASGIAAMLELSRRLAASGPHDRDIYILATSAEELGLLGAQAFVESPPVPLETIVAAFNFDSVAVAPQGTPLGFIGEGLTPLDDIVKRTALDAGRDLGSREYANSFLRRHDGWVLLEAGVPAVLLSSAFSSQIALEPFLASRYHSPKDEADNLVMGGAIDDLLLHEELVKRVASTAQYTP